MYCAASYGCEYIFYAPSIEDLKIIVDKMIHQRTHLTFVIADFLWMYYDCDTGDIRYQYDRLTHIPKEGDTWLKGVKL